MSGIKKLWIIQIFLAGLLANVGGCHPNKNGQPATSFPGILSEDFGTGISLLMAGKEAKSAGGNPGLERWVLSREQLIGRNPYDERQKGKDLLVAIVAEYSDSGANQTPALPKVVELRVFPDQAESTLKLQGKLLVEMSPAAVIELFGEPLSIDRGMDGNTHLSFVLSTGGPPPMLLELVTSHLGNGRCFAAALSISQMQ